MSTQPIQDTLTAMQNREPGSPEVLQATHSSAPAMLAGGIQRVIPVGKGILSVAA